MTAAGRLDLADLRLILAIAETGSIGQAARRLQISQPAASKRLTTLERTLHIPLLVRSTRGSRLTTEGAAIADWARQVLETVDAMIGAIDAMRSSDDVELRVASSLTLAEHLVPGWLSQLRRRHPQLQISLQVANSHEVQERVAKREADLGFVETPLIDARLNVVELARDELIVIAGPQHPWAGRTSISAAELRDEPLIVREAGSGTRDTLTESVGDIEALLEMNSNAAIKSAVIAGAGAAVLSRLAVASDLASRQLIGLTVQDADLHRRLCAVWSRHTRLTDPALALLNLAGGDAGV